MNSPDTRELNLLFKIIEGNNIQAANSGTEMPNTHTNKTMKTKTTRPLHGA